MAREFVLHPKKLIFGLKYNFIYFYPLHISPKISSKEVFQIYLNYSQSCLTTLIMITFYSLILRSHSVFFLSDNCKI